jgi:glycosyltransferase involved in cell wall biosynthesis
VRMREGPTEAKVVIYLHATDVLAGGERSLLNLIRHLDPNTFRARAACDATDEYVASLEACGTPVERLRFPGLRPPGPAALRAVWGLTKFCKRVNAAILHANTPRTNLYAALAGRVAKVPVIWHCRNLLEPGMRDTDRWFAWLPDRIICNSAAIAARFTGSRWQDRVVTITNGVDLMEYRPDLSGAAVRAELGWAGRPLIAAISRLDREKGHEVLLEAMRRVVMRCPDARLVIAGRAAVDPAGRQAALQRYIENLGLGEAARLVGFRRDIPELLAAADICVLPALAEACGRVLLEAMAMAKPVVGTASGGTPEIVKDGVTGILVPPGDPGAMAAALENLLQDPTRAGSMGAAGRERTVAHFSIEAHAEKTMRLYAEALAGRRTP